MTSASFADDFNIDKFMNLNLLKQPKDYQEIANFYGFRLLPDRKNMGNFSRITSYIKNEDDQTIYEVHWFADGLVATKMNGPDKGNQTIFINGQVFDKSSSPQYRDGDETIYRYSWGQVNIWPDGCYIELNSNN